MKHTQYLVMLAFFSLTACNGAWDQSGKEKLPGERIAITPQAMTLPEGLASVKVRLAATSKNASWESIMLGAQVENPELSVKLTKKYTIKLHSVPGDFGYITTPIVASGLIIALDTEGDVVAFDWQTGKEKWRNSNFIKLSNASMFDAKYFAGGLLFANNTVFATAGNSDVIAIDAASGKTKWTHKLTGITRAVPVANGSDVLIQTLEGSLYALSMQEGKISWLRMGNAEAISVISTMYPEISGKYMFVQTGGQGVSIYDLTSKSEINLEQLSDAAAYEYGDGIDESVYIITRSGASIYAYGRSKLIALNAASGMVTWKRHVSVAAPLAASGNALFALAKHAGSYHLLAMDKATGNLSWRRDIQKDILQERQVELSAPFVAGGRVGLMASDGKLYWFDPQTGKDTGEMEIEDGVFSSRPVVVNGSMLVTSSNGSITRYDSAT